MTIPPKLDWPANERWRRDFDAVELEIAEIEAKLPKLKEVRAALHVLLGRGSYPQTPRTKKAKV